jgi:hypothetical protein
MLFYEILPQILPGNSERAPVQERREIERERERESSKGSRERVHESDHQCYMVST